LRELAFLGGVTARVADDQIADDVAVVHAAVGRRSRTAIDRQGRPDRAARAAELVAAAIGGTGRSLPPDVRRQLEAIVHGELDGGQPLDDATRAAVERTTGVTLGEVRVEYSAAIGTAGRLGEASGDVIRLAPEASGDDELGRRVRLHEAIHIAQGKVSDSVAVTDRTTAVESEAHTAAAAAERGESHRLGVKADPAARYGFDERSESGGGTLPAAPVGRRPTAPVESIWATWRARSASTRSASCAPTSRRSRSSSRAGSRRCSRGSATRPPRR
jgi:hypothetical protein